MNKLKRRSPLNFSMISGFLVATIVLLGFSIAGYAGELHHLIDLTAHFKVQYLLLSLIPFIFFILKRHQLGIALSLCCLCLNGLEVIPWYIPQPVDSAGQPVRILFSNVNKYHAQYDRVIAMTQAEQPDIAVFVEVGTQGVEALNVLQSQLPYLLAHQHIETDGTAIYSKFPLLNPEIKTLGAGRKVVMAQLEIGGKPVTLMAAHPSNAVGKIYVEERNQQLDAIATEIQSRSDRFILAADLNTTPWSPHYRRSLGKARLHNTRQGFGILPTWSRVHDFFAIPIDHILVSPEIGTELTRVGRSVGSDHLPLISDLRIR
jgi:endonuclease/exonuclease/phosphatase (EEP) superfamily protein YafD